MPWIASRIVLIIVFFTLSLLSVTSQASHIVKLTIHGSIGPETADYVSRAMSKATHADLILVTMDTASGLESATKSIMHQFLRSPVPIVTYVNPVDAQVHNVGVYLMYASTLSAMTPGTTLSTKNNLSLDKTLSTAHMPVSDVAATLKALAQLHGHATDFATRIASQSLSLTAEEALHANVIHYIASNEQSLLSQLNKQQVVQNGKKIVINTSHPHITEIAPDLRLRFLGVVTNPGITYFLLLLGIYGIFFALLNPRWLLIGLLGAASLLLALYALQYLPINSAGFSLVILGLIFIIAEGFMPCRGILGLGGTIFFVIGSIMLIHTFNGDYQIAWLIIGLMVLINITLFIIYVGAILKSRRQQQVRNGLLPVIGSKGRALGIIHREGQAIIRGDVWQVTSLKEIAADRTIQVIDADGLIVHVEEDVDLEE